MNKEDRARIEELKKLIAVNDPLPWKLYDEMSTNRWDLTILAMNSLPILIEIIEKQADEIRIARERLGPAGYRILDKIRLQEKQIAILKDALYIGLDFAAQVHDQVACPPAEIDSFEEAAKKALEGE